MAKAAPKVSRRARLSPDAERRLWHAATVEQQQLGPRRQNERSWREWQARPRSKTDSARLEKAIKALEQVRWIDLELFRWLRLASSRTDGTESYPINALIAELSGEYAKIEDRIDYVRERLPKPDPGRPNELGHLATVMRREIANGERQAAVVRWYVDTISGNGGFPDLSAEELRDRLRKTNGKKSTGRARRS